MNQMQQQQFNSSDINSNNNNNANFCLPTGHPNANVYSDENNLEPISSRSAHVTTESCTPVSNVVVSNNNMSHTSSVLPQVAPSMPNSAALTSSADQKSKLRGTYKTELYDLRKTKSIAVGITIFFSLVRKL